MPGSPIPAVFASKGIHGCNFGGKPFFILVATGGDATLVLTRDGRVLRGAAPASIIEALAGIALEPDDMRALVAGCAIDTGDPTDGRSFAHGWASVRDRQYHRLSAATRESVAGHGSQAWIAGD